MSNVVSTMWQDARYALRNMRKRTAFAATAILTLGLGIGGTTAMFTVIQAVLLQALPYPDSDRLVNIPAGATPVGFGEMQATARSFTAITAFTAEESPTLSGAGDPEVVKGVRVSGNFLEMLGVYPIRGRSFRPEEDRPGAPPVAMISARLWEGRFASDPEIVGKTVNLAETPYTIIGVLPPRFAFPYPDVDVWMTVPIESPLYAPKSREMSPFLTNVGRLKPGVTLAQARAEVDLIRHQYAIAHPAMLDAKPKRRETVKPLKDTVVADARSVIWILSAAVAFVLLAACANVASLLLAHANSRTREIAVRSALGAARLRLMGQLVNESIVLALLAGALGVLLAASSLRAIPSITAFELPRAQEIHLNWIVLGFAAAISIVTGVFFGLAPAVGTSRTDVMRLLRVSGEDSSKGISTGFFRRLNLEGILLSGQVALSIVLLIGAALLLATVNQLRGVSLGFNAGNLLTASLSLPVRYDTNPKRERFWEELLQRVASVPGIRSVSASLYLPMMAYPGTPVQDASKPRLRLNQRPLATIGIVTPGYFRTLEIPLIRGRDFTPRDKEGQQRVAIIDEAFARRFWPAYPGGQNPIGQHILVGGVNLNPVEVVGIVASVHQALEGAAWPETVYMPLPQGPPSFGVLAVRTDSNPFAFSGALREQLRSLDPNQSFSAVRTMDQLVDEQLGQRRLLMMLLGSFATVALFLVLIGLYGMIAYSVAQRTREVGIRRALGAGGRDILWLVVGRSFYPVLTGLAAGLVGAFGLTRLIEGLLFHVSPTDPAIFAAVVLLFLLVALAASYIPARRATRIDPAVALRL